MEYDIVQQAFIGLWDRMIIILPRAFAAFMVVVIGWAIALTAKFLIEQVLRFVKLDILVDKLGLEKVSAKTGYKLRASTFLAGVVKWFLIVAFVLAASDIIGLSYVSLFLKDVLMYIPNIIVAAMILIAGLLLGEFVADIIKGSVRLTELGSSDFVSAMARWAIVIFSFLAALLQLRVTPELIQILFTGIVAMLAIAGGLAFGLGGRDTAVRMLDHIEKEFTSKK